MNIKPDDKLAICVRSLAGNDGRLFKILGYAGLLEINRKVVPAWNVEALDGKPVYWTAWPKGEVIRDDYLRAIRDNPGNESFVVKARKTPPQPTPVTGPVTINERGEPALTNEQVRRALGRRDQA